MALMMNAHKESQDIDKEHDTEFKEAYGTSVKRGKEVFAAEAEDQPHPSQKHKILPVVSPSQQ